MWTEAVVPTAGCTLESPGELEIIPTQKMSKDLNKDLKNTLQWHKVSQ